MTEAKSLRGGTTKGGKDSGAPADGKRRGGMRSMGQLVPKLTRPILGKHGFAAAEILLDWPAIVGEDLSRVCRPDRLSFPRGRRNGGTLLLRVLSSAATELQHESPRLLERVNRYFGYAAVDRLKLIQAPLGGLPSRPAAPRPPTRTADPAALAALHERLAGVDDQDLRETLERLGASVLAESRDPPEK